MNSKDKLFLFLVFCYALIFLIIDYVLPLGVSVGNFYILLIISVSFLIDSKKLLYISTCICSLFIIVGFIISPVIIENHYGVVNRGFNVVLMLVGCFLGSIFIDYRLKEKKLKEQFILAMAAAPNSMALVDSDGKIIYANESMHNLFLYDENKLISRNVQELIPSELKSTHSSHINKYFRNPERKKMGTGRDLIGKKSNGEIIYLEIGINPLHIDDKNMVIIGISDLTERLRYQKEIEGQLKEREMFSYSLSHDFKSFLRRIKSFSDLLLKKINNTNIENASFNETDKEYLEFINSESLNAQTLVEDLETYINSSNISDEFSKVSLNKVFNDIVSNNSEIIRERNVNITIKELSSINGLESNIYLLFANIVINAIKHNKEGVNIKINQKLTENSIIVAVEDNGTGIDENLIKKVFTPFKKLHNDKNIKGSGLGMAMAKNIVGLHNGNIWIESEKGEGTTFYTEFPLGNI